MANKRKEKADEPHRDVEAKKNKKKADDSQAREAPVATRESKIPEGERKEGDARQVSETAKREQGASAVLSEVSQEQASAQPRKPAKLSTKQYEEELAKLHVELVKLQEWVKFKGLKIVIIFEGRDAAGKGGHHQAHHRVPESALRPSGSAGRAHRARENAMVLSALRRPPAGGR
jgi:hypothetical protein